ncbi:MAG TPA: cytochrome c [Geminicoccaceae bacterium]|nr:cytochrome c [Geminicoccaceae bacterium]
MRLIAVVLVALLGGGFAWLLVPWPWSPPEIARAGDPKHGEYVLRLGGCVSCHTDEKRKGQFLAGGRALETPFGTFYPPNITPDAKTGIGGWSTGAFVQAMTRGRSPGGHPLYPAFPYTSYTRMAEQDLVDLKAYLDTVPPVASPVPAHELRFPFGFRPLLKGWQLLFFEPGTFQPDPNKSENWNRGAYIVNGPGHCGECHTPRNALGAPDPDRFLAGTRDGPDGKAVPNITPNRDNGIGNWSKTDITFALQTGILPDGDVLGGLMAEEIKDASSHYTPEDRAAVAEYLLSLPPLAGPPRSTKPSAPVQ